MARIRQSRPGSGLGVPGTAGRFGSVFGMGPVQSLNPIQDSQGQISSEYGTYKTVKARFRANMAHVRQSSQIQDSQARSKRVKPDPERIWHVSDSRGQILAWAYQGHQGASDPY
jgi:hypothetical protein